MLRILRRMAGVCAALALVSANAATVTYSFTNPLSATEINQTGSLSLFDSNLGTLTGASLTVTGNLESVVTFVNSAAKNQRIRLISSRLLKYSPRPRASSSTLAHFSRQLSVS